MSRRRHCPPRKLPAKPIMLKLSTNMRPEEGVTVIGSRFGQKITLLGITWLPDLPSTCLRALNSYPIHALSVESLTLVVAPILAELLHLTRLQGVFWGLQDIGENLSKGDAWLPDLPRPCFRSQCSSLGHFQQKSLWFYKLKTNSFEVIDQYGSGGGGHC